MRKNSIPKICSNSALEYIPASCAVNVLGRERERERERERDRVNESGSLRLIGSGLIM